MQKKANLRVTTGNVKGDIEWTEFNKAYNNMSFKIDRGGSLKTDDANVLY